MVRCYTTPLLGGLQIILFFLILECECCHTLASFTLDADIPRNPLFCVEHPLTTARAQYADEIILVCQCRILRNMITPEVMDAGFPVSFVIIGSRRRIKRKNAPTGMHPCY